jgi:arsenate reductase-like glutaredoxin family protein
LELADLINKKSQAFKKMAVDLTELDESGIIRLMGDNPRIIIRPLLSDGQQILQGFNEQDYTILTSQKDV